jgi:hypothetical protein
MLTSDDPTPRPGEYNYTSDSATSVCDWGEYLSVFNPERD